jgi:hypothetical protein
MCLTGCKSPSDPNKGDGETPTSCTTTPCPKRRRVVKITARLAVTPSKRVNHATLPPRTHEVFTSTSNVKALATNAPTVLVRNLSAIKLIAETDPANQTDVAWSIEPNPGPASPKPELTASGYEATLQPSKAGGYAISASLDGSTVYWNVVLFDVTINNSAVQLSPSKPTDRSGGAWVGISTGVFDVDNPAVCAMYVKATVTLSAGGQAPLDTYADRITVGTCQDITSDTTAANYQDGGRVRSRYVVPAQPGVPVVVDPSLAVTDIGFPMLDTGLGGATGGSSVFLSRTRSTPATGKTRVVETCDSPGRAFNSLHPEFNKAATKRILTVSGSSRYTCYLVAFSSDAVFSFVAYGSASWVSDISGTVAFSGATATYTAGGSAGITGASEFAAVVPGKEADKVGCEVMPPADLDPYWIFDAR